ncbi:MAG: DUF5985 family protein [Sphingomonadaceae bacterium]|nr:DUF5985 family protein [Sphingomonadaceae bacterium]
MALDPMFYLLSGLIVAGDLIAALFFLKFWRRSGDTLFAIFSAAFLLLALGQALLALTNVPVEERSWIYLLRLAAFILIIAGIVHKNRAD